MEYLKKSFSVGVGGDESYRANWEATFGKKTKKCAEVIPNTFIACGEGGNYCSEACEKAAK